jgi:DNA-binding transcriptional ArsR family regulator
LEKCTKQNGEEMLTLPEEIVESLCACGGIEGLIESIPPSEALVQRSAVFRALADPTRLKILAMLSIQPLCVCVIKHVLNIADSKLSYHLNVLKKAGLISGEYQKNWIIYRITEKGKEWVRTISG